MFGFGRRKETAPERREPTLAAVPAVRNAEYRLTDIEELSQLFGAGAASYAGPPVTADTAMRSAAVYACIRLISGSIASLPLPVYRRASGREHERVDHLVARLLNDQPNAAMTAAVFWKYMVSAELLCGDQIAIIGRTAGGDVVDLVPVDPRAVTIERKDGRLRYYVAGPDGEYFGLDQDDVLHVPGEGFNLRTCRGMSVISYAAKQAIGLALATEEYSARFFSNGARPDVVLKYPNRIVADEIKRLREYWLNKHQGLANSHMPAVLTEGGDVVELTMSAEDSQLIQARQFQVIDIARAFGVPPIMIGESEKTSSWGTGVEQVVLAFVKFTLRNHLTKIEQEVNRKLFRSGRFFAEFNIEGLLRGDSKSRSEFIRGAIGGSQGPGYMTINEARRLENLPPIEGGDRLYDPVRQASAGDQNAQSAEAVPG
jgi:HK97 family phage portal protein